VEVGAVDVEVHCGTVTRHGSRDSALGDGSTR
jgi:hypothetical protein